MNAEIVAILAAAEEATPPEEIARLRDVLDQQSEAIREATEELKRRDAIIQQQSDTIRIMHTQSDALSKLLPPANTIEFIHNFVEAMQEAAAGDSVKLDGILAASKSRVRHVSQEKKLDNPKG